MTSCITAFHILDNIKLEVSIQTKFWNWFEVSFEIVYFYGIFEYDFVNCHS